ncbi:MAG: RdgB/HAM1 family non-canonical purine NTP pyrophosphatase [Sedimentisphaerales bacterium]|nr:RdgB/HAM1 family non-canonical purine NTP pyrophosphatase [Sedimentisphaerales bacterium]
MTDNMRDILVATTNPGKIKELRACLSAKVNWLNIADFGNIVEIEEDGDTFSENARKKATGYAKSTGLWTLADDSGLVVDALGGEPGVKSARFSGEKLTCKDRTLIDHRNIAMVLKLMKDAPEEKRAARFVCSLCLASPIKVLIETQGILEGRITMEEIGTNGFGYDPIFYLPHLKKTVAQLTPEEKNKISHRGKAIKNLEPLLKELLKNS